MRLIHNPPLPRDWINHPYGKGIVVEGEVRVSRRSRLAAKVLVFRSRRNLVAFWRRALGQDIGGALAGVTPLMEHSTRFLRRAGRIVEQTRIQADPRYFCIVGFAIGSINMEIITHEAVHAGFAYAKRVKRSPYKAEALNNDEEEIAYPVGRIARGINMMFHDLGVYDDQRRREARQSGSDVRKRSARKPARRSGAT